ncbi:hypothetical protein EYF80_014889 [Liparis tanakae]|uniref:Uncharacterized protein n=1 Tax=Liparis tanakae TaxID=230148 RepID=A0A4Z2I9M3_9TELE|nr:hypothetical protein EYF80_014889 [Liparis tanakae]
MSPALCNNVMLADQCVSSSLDLRDGGHNTGRPESRCTRQVPPNPSTHIVSLQERTQLRRRTLIPGERGRHPAIHAPVTPPSVTVGSAR